MVSSFNTFVRLRYGRNEPVQYKLTTLNAPSLVYFDLIVHLGHHHCLSSGDLKLADKDVLDSYNDVVCLPSLTLSLI